MKKGRIYFILSVLGLAGALIFSRRIWVGYQHRININSHLEGENMARLRALHLCIDSAALTEPAIFAALFRDGWQGAATALPVEITTNFPFGTNVSQYYLDVWGKPFKVRVARGTSTAGSPSAFEIQVWSTGGNGIDENRAGDDEFVPWKALDIPPPTATNDDTGKRRAAYEDAKDN